MEMTTESEPMSPAEKMTMSSAYARWVMLGQSAVVWKKLNLGIRPIRLRFRLRASAAIMNKAGESGSPCLTPR